MDRQTPQQSHVEYDKEKDLVDYITVVLKHKWLIVVCSVLCVLVAMGYKVIYPDVEQFEAKASLIINPTTVQSEILPYFSVDVYQALAEARDLRLEVVDSLNAFRDVGQRLSPRALDGALKVDMASQGEGPLVLMDFVVTSSDTNNIYPAMVANLWARLFVKKNRGMSSNAAIGSYEYIHEQYRLAKLNIEAKEDSLVQFNKQYNIEALKTEFDTKNSKFKEYQASFINISFELRSLKNSLADAEAFLTANEDADGMWVGSLVLANMSDTEDSNLTPEQRKIRQTVMQIRNDYSAIKEEIRQFHLQNSLSFEETMLPEKRSNLIAYLTELSQLKIDSGVVEQTLRDQGEHITGTIEVPSSSSITSAALREFTSFKIGYNLSETRLRHLQREIDRSKHEIDSLNLAHSGQIKVLENLNKQFGLVAEGYQIFEAQYSTIKKQYSQLELSLGDLQLKVLFYRSEIKGILDSITQLKSQIAVLEMKKNRLNRELEIQLQTFSKFAKLLEDARIAKAGQPEDIKVVARAVSLDVIPSETVGVNFLVILSAGLVLSIFMAFVIEYWQQAREKLNSSQ